MHRGAIEATLAHGLSNGLTESTNTKIRLLTRIAFGFARPEALIVLAMLALGGHYPTPRPVTDHLTHGYVRRARCRTTFPCVRSPTRVRSRNSERCAASNRPVSRETPRDPVRRLPRGGGRMRR
jgi:hypothetical protein